MAHDRVLIAGAGPVGLSAAANLVHDGVPVTVFEAGRDLSEESRASTFHPPTLDMLDDLGAAQPLIAQGLIAPQFQYRARAYGVMGQFDFAGVASFAARIVEELDDFPLPEATLLNINSPAGEVKGAQVTSLGKRHYNDKLQLQEEDERGRKRYRIYGMEPGYEPQDGSDLTAVHDGYIAVTPIHFDLTDVSGMEALSAFEFDRLLKPAARELD